MHIRVPSHSVFLRPMSTILEIATSFHAWRPKVMILMSRLRPVKAGTRYRRSQPATLALIGSFGSLVNSVLTKTMSASLAALPTEDRDQVASAIAAVDLVAIARATGADIRPDRRLATTLTIRRRVGVEGPTAKITNGRRRLWRRIGQRRLRVNWSLPVGGKTDQRAAV